MSDVIDNSNVSSIEKYDNRIRVSNYDLTRFGNERFLDLCGENPEYPEVTRFTETDYFQVDFSGAKFDDLEFNDCTFTECNFEKTCLMIAEYMIAVSTGAILQPAPSIPAHLTKTGL